jgi:folate-dependent tRNA-U54 methylase TrmFO/GidA
MNISFGLLRSPEIQAIRDKQRKKEQLVVNALKSMEDFAADLQSLCGSAPLR